MLEIIRGTSGAGKTSQCLNAYRQALLDSAARGEVGSALWIAPTNRTVQSVLRRLLNEELQCCWSPGVMTFEQFAERVLRGSGTPASLVNSAQRRMLIKSVIRQAEQAGEIQHFRNICQTDGFASQLGRFISELKREETWPEDWFNALPPKNQQKIWSWEKCTSVIRIIC